MEQVTTEVIEQAELEAILAQVNTRTPSGARNYALLQLMAQTGIRCGEALQVKASDVRQEEWGTNGDRVKLWVLRLPAKATKGGKPRQRNVEAIQGERGRSIRFVIPLTFGPRRPVKRA